VRANICNWSKSLHEITDKYKTRLQGKNTTAYLSGGVVTKKHCNIKPGISYIKRFTAVIYEGKAFSPVKPYQPNQLFASKPTLPERFSPLGRPLVLPTNIRLDWKGLPGMKTLAYYGRKKFHNIDLRRGLRAANLSQPFHHKHWLFWLDDVTAGWRSNHLPKVPPNIWNDEEHGVRQID